MQRSRHRESTKARSLLFFWGALSGVYLAAVLYRLVALHQPIGMPTYAGVSALAAVWFALFDTVSPHEALRIGTIGSLFVSITLNAAVITRAILIDRTVPVARSIFTLLLLLGLLGTTLHALRQPSHKEKE